MQAQECIQMKEDKTPPDPVDFKMLYFTIHPGVTGGDTVIAYNRIPSLRLLCRGVRSARRLIKLSRLPSLTIKEGLELSYSLKRSDNSLDKEERWAYLKRRSIFQNYGSCAKFFAVNDKMMKVVSDFEERIKVAKRSRDKQLMKDWNDKMNVFLEIPYHDNFNASAVTKFRAFEYPEDDKLAVLCVNCPNPQCDGCQEQRKNWSHWRREAATKAAKSIGGSGGGANASNTPVQIAYYKSTKRLKPHAAIAGDCSKLGKRLRLNRSATVAELVAHEKEVDNAAAGAAAATAEEDAKDDDNTATAMSHYCSTCGKNFSSAGALGWHQRTCGAPKPPTSPSGEEGGAAASSSALEVVPVELIGSFVPLDDAAAADKDALSAEDEPMDGGVAAAIAAHVASMASAAAAAESAGTEEAGDPLACILPD